MLFQATNIYMLVQLGILAREMAKRVRILYTQLDNRLN